MAEYNTSGTMKNSYLYGNYIDEVLKMTHDGFASPAINYILIAERVRIGSELLMLIGFFAGFKRVVSKKFDYPRQMANIRY